MANETTTTTFTNALTVAVGRRFLQNIAPRAVVGSLFNTQDEGEGLATKVARMPTTAVTNPVAETADVTVAAITPTSVTITPDVTGIAFDIADVLGASSPGASLDAFVAHGADMLLQQSEDDIHGLFAGFTASVGTTTALTGATFLSGAVTLKVAQAPYPIFAVLHPLAVSQMAANLGGLGGLSAGTSVGLFDVAGGAPGLKGVVGSIPVYESPRTVDQGDVLGGFMGNRDAITIRRKWMVRPEQQRDAIGVSTNIVVTSCYGLAMTADSFGIEVLSED